MYTHHIVGMLCSALLMRERSKHSHPLARSRPKMQHRSSQQQTAHSSSIIRLIIIPIACSSSVLIRTPAHHRHRHRVRPAMNAHARAKLKCVPGRTHIRDMRGPQHGAAFADSRIIYWRNV